MKPFKKLLALALLPLLVAACAAKEAPKMPAKAQTQWKVSVKMSPEQRAQYEKQVKDLMSGIQNYKAVKSGDSVYAPLADYIDLARAYEHLGDYANALETYQRALGLHKRSQAVVNNLGRLYEAVGEYDKAVQQYLTLIKDYNEPNYAYDITWAYIRAGDRKNAEKYFNQWQLALHTTDVQTQEAIRKLREKEDAPSS